MVIHHLQQDPMIGMSPPTTSYLNIYQPHEQNNILYLESLGGYWLGYERTTLPRICYKYQTGNQIGYLSYYIQGTGGPAYV